ncbi:uncharacterized protein EV420DRAFT_1636759 [Desarmillaria tabescens]|uniref:Uncharacterized protein n=1 Tax=Armillaria tabescens TaxID=1929756 RepID=A0AA39NIA6_ARMTA|nr:uncharacterized protein EV420DRAFT_1636759 [Desarmillaria tabescens]KAK0466161.1 hypothetical protein EV420DRAFT_1636759 [Desarmillaria tabescens]
MHNWDRQATLAILLTTVGLYPFVRDTITTARHGSSPERRWKFVAGSVAVWDIGPLPLVLMDVEDTVNYQLNSTDHNNAQWSALAPGEGIVYLDPDHTPYLPSFFHQLRCLDILRSAYTAQEVDMGKQDVREATVARHCLNYLRQVLFCRSDLNLESVVSIEHGHHAVGRRRTQTCQDWRVVYKELERNQGHDLARSAM